METMKQRISRLLKEEKITKEMVQKYVGLGLITDEECQEIVGE